MISFDSIRSPAQPVGHNLLWSVRWIFLLMCYCFARGRQFLSLNRASLSTPYISFLDWLATCLLHAFLSIAFDSGHASSLFLLAGRSFFRRKRPSKQIQVCGISKSARLVPAAGCRRPVFARPENGLPKRAEEGPARQTYVVQLRRPRPRPRPTVRQAGAKGIKITPSYPCKWLKRRRWRS